MVHLGLFAADSDCNVNATPCNVTNSVSSQIEVYEYIPNRLLRVVYQRKSANCSLRSYSFATILFASNYWKRYSHEVNSFKQISLISFFFPERIKMLILNI